MTPAAIRRRLSRLEQSCRKVTGSDPPRATIWDVFCGGAYWDDLDKMTQEALRPILEETEPKECPIEKKIREVQLLAIFPQNPADSSEDHR